MVEGVEINFRLQILDFRLIWKRPVCHSDGGGIPASSSTKIDDFDCGVTCGDSSFRNDKIEHKFEIGHENESQLSEANN